MQLIWSKNEGAIADPACPEHSFGWNLMTRIFGTGKPSKTRIIASTGANTIGILKLLKSACPTSAARLRAFPAAERYWSYSSMVTTRGTSVTFETSAAVATERVLDWPNNGVKIGIPMKAMLGILTLAACMAATPNTRCSTNTLNTVTTRNSPTKAMSNAIKNGIVANSELRDVVTIPTNNVAGKANSSTNSFKPWTWSRSNCLAYPAQKPRPMTNSTGKSTENELKKVEMNIHFSFCEGIS